MDSQNHNYEIASPKPIEELARELADLDPKPVNFFTPDNLSEITDSYLSGDTESINRATYSSLDAVDFDKKQKDYEDILSEIKSNPDVPKNHHRIYESFVAYNLRVNELMRSAVIYRNAKSEAEREIARQSFITINEELYGPVEVSKATSMAKEILDDSTYITDEDVAKIRSEFCKLLPIEIKENLNTAEKIQKPSDETKQFIKRVTETLYSPLLRHADELIGILREESDDTEKAIKLNAQAIAVIFQTIIDQEFPDSGWKVILGPANAIKVTAATKTITVKENRTSASPNQVRGLVVHELGVHMLRSIIGEKTDMPPLRLGLEGVGDSEEGIAKIMESTISGDGSRTGHQHYLTATLINQGYSFDEAFEVMWRYKVLDVCIDKPVKSLDEKFLEKQKKTTFNFMFRAIRGTNGLPWHTTLSYYKGAKMWQYIESHMQDPDLVTFLFMGKIDPTNIDQLKSGLEAKGRE